MDCFPPSAQKKSSRRSVFATCLPDTKNNKVNRIFNSHNVFNKVHMLPSSEVSYEGKKESLEGHKNLKKSTLSRVFEVLTTDRKCQKYFTNSSQPPVASMSSLIFYQEWTTHCSEVIWDRKECVLWEYWLQNFKYDMSKKISIVWNKNDSNPKWWSLASQ